MLYGEITNELTIKPYNKKLWKQTLQKLRGKKFEAEFKLIKKRRTTQQNRYYWLIVGEIMAYTGHEKNLIHEANKMKFLSKIISIEVWDYDEDLERIPNTNRMEEIQTVGSTTELSKTDGFSEFLDKVIAFWSDFGIVFPDYQEWRRLNGFPD